jgi:hypothetical protein
MPLTPIAARHIHWKNVQKQVHDLVSDIDEAIKKQFNGRAVDFESDSSYSVIYNGVAAILFRIYSELGWAVDIRHDANSIEVSLFVDTDDRCWSVKDEEKLIREVLVKFLRSKAKRAKMKTTKKKTKKAALKKREEKSVW